MLKAIKRWYLNVKLRLIDREIADSADDQEQAIVEGDVDTVIATENWLECLARDRMRLIADIRRLS